MLSQPKVLPLELCVLQLHLTLQASGGVSGSCFWARSYPKCSIFRSLFLEPFLPKWEIFFPLSAIQMALGLWPAPPVPWQPQTRQNLAFSPP